MIRLRARNRTYLVFGRSRLVSSCILHPLLALALILISLLFDLAFCFQISRLFAHLLVYTSPGSVDGEGGEVVIAVREGRELLHPRRGDRLRVQDLAGPVLAEPPPAGAVPHIVAVAVSAPVEGSGLLVLLVRRGFALELVKVADPAGPAHAVDVVVGAVIPLVVVVHVAVLGVVAVVVAIVTDFAAAGCGGGSVAAVVVRLLRGEEAGTTAAATAAVVRGAVAAAAAGVVAVGTAAISVIVSR